jgi:hypothetical protein
MSTKAIEICELLSIHLATHRWWSNPKLIEKLLLNNKGSI